MIVAGAIAVARGRDESVANAVAMIVCASVGAAPVKVNSPLAMPTLAKSAPSHS